MITLIDWATSEPRNPGTPGWWTLAVRLSGETPTTHRSVFAAVEEPLPATGPCRVLIAAEFGDVEQDVLTPFVLELFLTREGVREFEIVGVSRSEVMSVATP